VGSTRSRVKFFKKGGSSYEIGIARRDDKAGLSDRLLSTV